MAYLAPHRPLHAREKTIAPDRERYLERGWGDWMRNRIKRQREMGLIPAEWSPAPVAESIPDWKDDPHKKWQAERMAVYAAQISNVDRGVGRMLEVLRESGQADNTLVLFLSDNGAALDGGLTPSTSGFGFGPDEENDAWRKDRIPIKPGSGPDLMPGPRDTFAGYGKAWATTSNSPFRDHKQSAYEGGIRTPLIARWPTEIQTGGGLTSQPGHVIDIMATCLDVAGIDYPDEFKGRRPIPMEGKSLSPIFKGEERKSHEFMAWRTTRGRAISIDDWKLVRTSHPTDDRPWELYNLPEDGGETNNLAWQFPNRVEAMAEKYEN